MRNPVSIAGVASIVALAAIAFVFAVTGDDDEPGVVSSPQPTATVDSVSTTPGGPPGARPTAVPPQPTATVDSVSTTPGGPPGARPIAAPPQPTATVDSVSTTPAVPPLPPDRRAVPAPIDGLEILILESFPVQYLLNVQAGLPSGCAEQYKHEVERAGDVITVTVLNSLPTATDIACTAIYGMYELNIDLGSDFESGETYTVLVNDEETTFTAQ